MLLSAKVVNSVTKGFINPFHNPEYDDIVDSANADNRLYTVLITGQIAFISL